MHGLTKRYGRRVGIEDLGLSVPEGALFGFLGPNGSGKTTTIRVLLSLLRPTRGRATILGRDCWRQGPRIKRDVGYVPGDFRFYPWMNLRTAVRIFGLVRRRDLSKAGQAMAERFDLEPDVVVRRMSRGMRQKLALILALVHRPNVLVLDEPTSSLDPLMQQVLFDELRERSAQGTTVFFSSHTLSEVDELCDRVAILRKGRLVVAESLDKLRSRARRAVTLRWASTDDAARAIAPPFLSVIERSGAEWQCTLSGTAMEFVRWSGTQPLADVTIGPPDLETVFRGFYTDTAGAS
ncbi:MAG: ABC transporter ATP-binding protein [Phycisphaerae bacterium]